jgi:hypothetical protein
VPIQKTFDQIRTENPSKEPSDSPDVFDPHKILESRIVLEPLPARGHIRVTARSPKYELLWGVVLSKEMLKTHPVEVAFYDTLIKECRRYLPVQQDVAGEVPDVLQDIANLKLRIQTIEEKLTPKVVSQKTENTADAVSAAIKDAIKLLNNVTLSDVNP